MSTPSLPPALQADPALAKDDMVVKLYAIGQVWARTNQVTAASVLAFVSTLMKAAERVVLKDGDGKHKKKAVMTVIHLILEDRDMVKMSSGDRAAVMSVVNDWVPDIIDWGVGLVHDPQGTIGKLSKMFSGLSPCCIPPAQKADKQ
jgi:hypothetical protein